MIWILPAVSAFIFDLPFEKPFLWFLAFLGLIPLFLFLEKARNRIQAFLGGWIFGSLFFILVLRWLIYAYPLDWAGVKNPFLGMAVIFFIWIVGAIFVGASGGFFTWLIFPFFRHDKKSSGFLEFLAIPASFVLMEFSRALLFGLFIWAPGAQSGLHWSFGNIGYALIDTPVIFWSRIIGIYGLGFFVALGNLALFRIFRLRGAPLIKPMFFLICMALIFFLPKFRVSENGKNMQAVLVHTQNRDGILNTEDFDNLWKEAVKAGDSRQPDLVVLPEAEQLFTFFSDKDKNLISRIFPDKNKPGIIVTGDYSKGLKGISEQTVYLDQNGSLISQQKKSFLMPLGEYLPGILKIFLSIFNPNAANDFESSRTLEPALVREIPVNSGELKVGALLCSGIISPELYRSLANEGANVLVNSASQIIFKDKPFYVSQMETLARFQAISNTRPFLQANNGGKTFFIDADGEITSETGGPQERLLVNNFSPVAEKTIYTRIGNWPVIIFSFLIVLAASFIVFIG